LSCFVGLVNQFNIYTLSLKLICGTRQYLSRRAAVTH
jgi:hypothetical protein